jgi:hypothetical protein
MASSRSAALAPIEHIGRSILLLRGQRVILDRDLAAIYGVVSVTPGTLWPDRLPAGNRPAQFTTRGAATWSEDRLGFQRQP